MNAIPYEDTFTLPGRPRRRLWGPASAALIAALVGAIGFYSGVRVEKGQVSGTAGSAAGSGRTPAAGTRAGAAGAAGFRGLAAGGGAGVAGLGGGAGPGGGGGPGGGNSSFGTVSTITGKTLYVTDASGNTIKVNLSSATKITKSLGVAKSAVRPGDTVVVQGLKGSGGSVQATSVNDAGARGGSSGAPGGSSSSGSGSSARSAVNSLFGGG
jgi:hypothetical protein